jgi:ATP-binding cassette subfamily B protein
VAAHTTLTRLRNRMFLNLVQQDIAFYDAHVSGELSSRLINDSGQLQGLAQFTTQQLLQATVRLVGAVVAMYMTHPLLAVLATVISPLNYFIVRRAGYLSGLYGVVQNAALAKSNQVAVEALGAIRTVQANTGEVGEARGFAASINRFLRVVLVTVITQTVVIFTQLGLSKIRDVVVLGFGMWEVITGTGPNRLTIGSFTAFNTYVSLYEQGFSSMANIWINLRQVLVSAGRFLQLMDRWPGVVGGVGDAPASCRGALELRDVSFRYPGAAEQVVLERMSFTAEPGTVVALVGESGAGKSTVGRLIERFYDPQEGGLYLDGVDFRRLELRWLRQQIGLVEQEPTLFDRSLVDNIKYGRPHASFEEVQRAARLANAESFILALPEGYETKPGEKGVRISGGQKQRIAIARAICKNPALLLLDEATSALDTANEAVVQAALDTLMEGKTTVVIAHRLSTVVRANQIIVLDKGRAVERGTHDELAAIPDSRYSSFMRHQLLAKKKE